MNELADLPRADGGLRELALFAGAGGGILGGQLLGWHTVCAVEWEPYPASVLAARQNDGLLPPFPIWDDVRTFDGRPWRGIVDVVSGGFPCQDISVAGKGAGIDGERSGMWTHMARIVGEVRPCYVFVENSPALVTRGLGRVVSDLAALGYDCRWTVLGAADVGAPHQRDRFWLVAHAGSGRHGYTQNEVRAGRHAVEHGSGALADTYGLRELQPQGRQRHERGWAGDCGCEVANTEELGPSHWDARTIQGRTEYERQALEPERCSGQDGALADTARLQPGRQEQRPERERTRHRHANGERLAQRQGQRGHACEELAAIERADWWLTEPDVGRNLDGLAEKLDPTSAAGVGG